MKYKKYRELVFEPNQINFKKIQVLEILNYMPAGNDVIECLVNYNSCIVNAFIKIERSRCANFSTEIKHISYLNDNSLYNKIPLIYEYGLINDKTYLVEEKIKGKRLSEILLKSQKNKDKYLYNLGAELALIHQINPNNFDSSYQRVINDIPSSSNYDLNDEKIKEYLLFLQNNKPNINNDTFIHGDFHYANVLWHNRKISAVLDWEYSGKGFKEQDIAWALILRPCQKFLDNITDIKCFLEGYQSINNYDKESLKWCLINGYLHFYLMNKDEKYKSTVLKLMKQVTKL